MSEFLEPKDPSDTKDYGVDWSAVLAADGETTIATSTWAITPTGPTLLASPAPAIVGAITSVWVSGGTANVVYTLTNTIVTGSATPRTHQRSVSISCQER